MLKSLEDESHVKTRICQYEALKNGKGIEIAKQIVHAKILSQNIILRKYGLRQHDLTTVQKRIADIESDNLNMVRKRLLPIEGKCSEHYFREVFQLLPKAVRIENRKGFNAYDGINNIFNLAYEVLKWKIHVALINAKLEPYLGFIHNVQFGKPSLVCDFQELYRYLIDDFVIQYSRKLTKKDFIFKTENYSGKRKGKRQYLNGSLTKDLMEKLSRYFEFKVEIARIRHGSKQQIETLIDEEALLFAKYLRNEIPSWNPRIVQLSN